MPGDWVVTVRQGGRVKKERHGSPSAALDALEAGLDAVAPGSRRHAIDLRVRRFEPIQQVAARGELKGPRGVRAGVDLRGDGSAEAYVGFLRRRLVELLPGETPYDALRRVLVTPQRAGNA